MFNFLSFWPKPKLGDEAKIVIALLEKAPERWVFQFRQEDGAYVHTARHLDQKVTVTIRAPYGLSPSVRIDDLLMNGADRVAVGGSFAIAKEAAARHHLRAKLKLVPAEAQGEEAA